MWDCGHVDVIAVHVSVTFVRTPQPAQDLRIQQLAKVDDQAIQICKISTHLCVSEQC